MRSVGRFKFKQENVEIKDSKAIVKLSLKFAWGDFPATFELKKKIIGGW